jgi:uncharacterized SAM-binding protein YcdF (DUF218 family)
MQPASKIEESSARRVTPVQVSRDVRKSRVLGLVNRKERWGLSWIGWLMLLFILVLAGVIVTFSVYPFLSITERVETDELVMEGWIPFYAVRSAAREFAAGSYREILTTGGPISGMGGYTNDYNTSASLGAGRLKAEGVPSAVIQMVPSRVSGRDRTYSAALALRHWLDQQGTEVKAINVVTADTHARRTRLLYQEALGKKVEVGVIAVPNPDYDARRWWRYSEGVKEVITESVAYLYAKFFFWPATRDHKTTGLLDHRTTGQLDNGKMGQ